MHSMHLGPNIFSVDLTFLSNSQDLGKVLMLRAWRTFGVGFTWNAPWIRKCLCCALVQLAVFSCSFYSLLIIIIINLNYIIISCQHGLDSSDQRISIAGKYKTQLFDETSNEFMPASPGIGMHVEITDPEKKILLSKYYSSEGRFTFTSHTPGEHIICLHSNSTRWSLFAGGKLVSAALQLSVILS